MEFTPDAQAASTIGCASAASVRSPNIIVPRHSGDTRRPLSPKARYSILVAVIGGIAASSRGAKSTIGARRRRATPHAACSTGERARRQAIIRAPNGPARAPEAILPMHVYFEDDGQLKAGTVLADNDTSLQVEAVSGKRLKIKAAAVLLRFTDPSPAVLSADAQRLAGELDPNFLWEVSADDEFGFADLAQEYYGRKPVAPEAAAVALALASAPMYFYKRGKGRYRKAPPDALKAALASVERKKREAADVAAWCIELAADRLPEALRTKLPMLLHKPDKQSLEWKALMAACDARQTNPLA